MNRAPFARPARAALRALPLVLLLAASAAAAAPTLPRPVERTLPNGLRVVVLSQPRLPIVQIQLAVPGGSSADPVGLEGVAALTAQMLKRGTSSRTAEEYAADVDRLGGAVVAQVTRDQSTLSGSFLARDLETGLELLSNAALDPIFPTEELERLRVQTFRVLVQARSNPSAVADDEAWTLAFAGHPSGRPVLGSTRSLGAVTQEALRAYHRDVWRPDQAVLTIAGDVTPERALALAGDWFGRWAGRAAPRRPVQPVAAPSRPKLALLDLPGMGWAEVRLACVVPPRRAGDEALAIAANAFVGGPASRLGALRGGVAGALARGGMSVVRDGGLLLVSVTVPVDSAAPAVRRLRAELRAFVANPPGEAEIAPLRRAFAASFPLSFETLGGAIGQWQAALAAGIAPDDLARTADRLAAVRPDSVAAAVRRWFDPQAARVVVAGPADRLRTPLSALGPLETVTLDPLTPLTQFAGGDTLATATPERVTRGRAAVARAVEAHGGLARLRGISDSEVEGTMALGMGGHELSGQLHQVRKEPYRLWAMTQFVTLETRQVLDRTRGWVQSNPDSVGAELDSMGVAGLRATFAADLPHLLLAAADSAATVIWAGEGRPGAGTGTESVDVITAEGERRRYHFDRGTGRLTGMDQYESAAWDAALSTRRTYSDFRPVDGVQWPFREERRSPGDNSMRLDVKSVRLNQGVSDMTFVRPVPGR